MADKISAKDLIAHAKKDLEDVQEMEKALASLKGLQAEIKKAQSEVGNNEKAFEEAEE